MTGTTTAFPSIRDDPEGFIALLRSNAESDPRSAMVYTESANWIEQALEVLRAVEWSGNIDGWKTCPLCTADERAHAPDCKLAALIGAKVAE